MYTVPTQSFILIICQSKYATHTYYIFDTSNFVSKQLTFELVSCISYFFYLNAICCYAHIITCYYEGLCLPKQTPFFEVHVHDISDAIYFVSRIPPWKYFPSHFWHFFFLIPYFIYLFLCILSFLLQLLVAMMIHSAILNA